MLIKNNAELRKHLGGAISTALSGVGVNNQENDRILTYVPVADVKVRKAVGDVVMNALQAEYDSADGITDGSKELFDMIQKALAFYAYAEYMPFSTAKEGVAGLVVEKDSSPKLWMSNDRNNKAMEIAAVSLESALKLLFSNDYANFNGSTVFSELYGGLVNSGKALGVALPASGGSYTMWVTLWAYLNDCEEYEVSALIGQATYNRLKAVRNGSGLTASADETKAIQLCCKVVAGEAFRRALPQTFTVAATEDGRLRVLTEFDGIKNRKTATEEQYGRLMASIEMDIRRAKGELIKFMEGKRDVFTDYADDVAVVGRVPAFMEAESYERIFPLM